MSSLSTILQLPRFVPSYRFQIRTPVVFEQSVFRSIAGSLFTVILLSVIENFIQKPPQLMRTVLIGMFGLIFSFFAIYSVKRIVGLMLWISAIAYLFLEFSPFSTGNTFILSCLLFLPILAERQPTKTLILQVIFSGSILLIGFEAVQFLNLRAFFSTGALIEGLLFGVFAGVALLSRHIETHENRMIQCLFQTQKTSKLPELKGITSRTINLHRKVIKDLEKGDEALRLDIQRKVDELVSRISNSCQRANHLEQALEEISLGDIARNIDTCDANITKVNSSKVISMLHKVRKTTLEQKNLIDRIILAKQEATARALIDVTLLERLRISLLQLRNSNLTSAAPGPEISGIIEELSREIEATCDAVDEVFQEENPKLGFLVGSLSTEPQEYEVGAAPPETMIQIELPQN
ncbi:MAG: hypothetical protein VYC39_13845 [Myxococcota bacterium]|nr:hypothetical protein [Myxococcota bacterium]